MPWPREGLLQQYAIINAALTPCNLLLRMIELQLGKKFLLVAGLVVTVCALCLQWWNRLGSVLVSVRHSV